MARVPACPVAHLATARFLVALLLVTLEPELLHAERVRVGGHEGANQSAFMANKLWGYSGPTIGDVWDSRFAGSYFSAGLAAIAWARPKLIEQAFISKLMPQYEDYWKVKLEFLVDGVPTWVAVDSSVPECWSRFQPLPRDRIPSCHSGSHPWPLFLEKGFAKVFGSYLAIRRGWGYDTLRAITHAPVDVYQADVQNDDDKRVWEDPEDLWDTLSDAFEQELPVLAEENSDGTVQGETFAVLGFGSDGDIELYNKWGKFTYRKKKTSDACERKRCYGLSCDYGCCYTMTLDEFTEAFSRVMVARVRKDYSVRSFLSQRKPLGSPVAMRLKTTSDKHFTFQLDWPSPKFFDIHGCWLRLGEGKLLVARVGDTGFKSADTSQRMSTSGLHVDAQGPGEFLVWGFGFLDGAAFAERVMWFTAYANHEWTMTPVRRGKDALALGREILGFPCERVKWLDDIYTAMRELVQGSPAWGLTSASGSLKVIWLDDSGKLSLAPSAHQLDKHDPDFDPSELQCMDDPPRTTTEEGQKEAEALVERVGRSSSCDFVVGEQVCYQHLDTWTAGEVEAISSASMSIRYLRTGKVTLSCQSAKFKKVVQCKFKEGDTLIYESKTGKRISDRITHVGCGKVTFHGGPVVGCDSDRLHYNYCSFARNEKVQVKTQKGWIFSEVTRGKRDELFVTVDNEQVKFNCKEDEGILKLSRCEKLAHEQMERVDHVNNYWDLERLELRNGQSLGKDDAFEPGAGSVGPKGADCGSYVEGGKEVSCEKFGWWWWMSQLI